ncbi:MAG: glycosyltransferase family 39 protein [Deltaproteobacteria bacterium]|nr:glycosyltransferase family 39 protein [Deltaproteobacteria bacterium]
MESRRFTVDVALFLLVVFAYGYFHGGGSANQNTRFDAIFAFVEPGTAEEGTFRIDQFMRDENGRLQEPPPTSFNTCDWSWYPPGGKANPTPQTGERQGHYYSNKAPGTILLGTISYFLLYRVERLLGIDPYDASTTEKNLYLINLFVSVVIGALGIVIFRRILLVLGTGEPQALFLTLVLAFATTLFPYSIQMWGHTTAAAFSTMALYAIIHRSPRHLALSGFLVGMAAVTDYLGCIMAVIYGIYLASSQFRRVPWFVLGGSLPLVVLMAYHQACFDSPFTSAINYTLGVFRDDDRLWGVFGPISVEHAVAILLSRYRGVLVHMPILLLSLPGLVFWLRRNRRDRIAWLCLVSMGVFILMNASFNGWAGGASVCARYQILTLPFWVLCLKEVPWSRVWKPAMFLAAGLSAFNMLAVAAVSPIYPNLKVENDWRGSSPQYYNPLWVPEDEKPLGELHSEVDRARTKTPSVLYDSLYAWTYERFLDGRLAAEDLRWLFYLRIHSVSHWRPTNLGIVLGFTGLASLIPLVLVLIPSLLGLFWLTGSSPITKILEKKHYSK